MSTSFNQSAKPTTGRVIELLEEIKEFDLSLPDRNQPLENQKKQYEIKKRIVKHKIQRLEIYVVHWKRSTKNGWTLYNKLQKEQKKKKESTEMVNDKQGILHMINNGKETIITLNSYYDDLELALQQERSNGFVLYSFVVVKVTRQKRRALRRKNGALL
ncbi:unnamed protein product [Onchocerca ochengi]|uniref:Chromo domain-containing protein n=1 Tax=Onchocerca ochengi TaxID=42157 RepID=A0A182EUB6_ONCOC|nr:unnamed protein product [Onchocerca ochengi]